VVLREEQRAGCRPTQRGGVSPYPLRRKCIFAPSPAETTRRRSLGPDFDNVPAGAAFAATTPQDFPLTWPLTMTVMLPS